MTIAEQIIGNISHKLVSMDYWVSHCHSSTHNRPCFHFVCMNPGKSLQFRQLFMCTDHFSWYWIHTTVWMFSVPFGAAASLFLVFLIPELHCMTWETDHKTWRIKEYLKDLWKLENVSEVPSELLTSMLP